MVQQTILFTMNNLHFIELSQYERPLVTEETNRDWVGVGEDNAYYQGLIDCFMDSTTNQAVITGIAQQIYGRGLEATDAAQKPEMFAEMKKLLKPDVLRKISLDLKMLGEAALQITYKGKKVDKVTHFPRETLRPEKCNENGEIEAYYYSADWSKVRNNTKLTKIPVFGSKGTGNEIKIIKRYVTGYHYISPADYSTSYATLEKEIADYLINDAQNSFSGTKVINFNSGIPSEEKMQQIKSQVMNKLTGSFGEKCIIAFNHNAEQKTTVEDIPLNDAPQHYQYLSEECSKKILLSHRVTSPLLLGLRDGNSGLGSNSEEIENAQRLFSNTTIRPYQDLIIDNLSEVLAVNNISLNLYFKTLDPLEFMDIEVTNEEVIEEETGVKEQDVETTETTPADEEMETNADTSYNGAQISSAIDIIAKVQEGVLTEAQAIVFLIQFLQLPEQVAKGFFSQNADTLLSKIIEAKNKFMASKKNTTVSDEHLNSIADELINLGENEDELLKKYDVIDEMEVDYNQEERLDKMLKLTSTGRAYPNAKSEQDGTSKQQSQQGVEFLVRYTYSPKKVSANSREFCKKMVAADKVYRKEDILRMSNKVVNAGFGKGGSDTYSIWLYKGGARCSHKWFRKTYQIKDGKKTEITTGQARSKGFKAPVNEQKVSVAPKDMPNEGFVNPPKKKK